MRLSLLLFLLLAPAVCAAPTVVIAEGEAFTPKDAKGWKVTHQEDSYGSHTYGGMWTTHGGCLGAPANSAGSLATQTVTIPAAGKYRVWSKYQAPPYFNYLHKIEVIQGGKTLFSHTYGKSGTPRLWSFSGVSDELFWFWGVDHDAAEAPKTMVDLKAGAAEIRLTTVKNPDPAGDRFVDFVVLTTEDKDTYEGFKPYRVGSPFTLEALAASKLYLRFQNTTTAAAQLTVTRNGHFQPNYGGATQKFPAQAVKAGAWSEWVNIGPFCRLVHDEGLLLTLPGAKSFKVQFARDPAGKDSAGEVTLTSPDWVCVPIDVTWNKKAKVEASRVHAERLIKLTKTWRRANGGKKPEKILFLGAFAGQEDWLMKLKDALGYNGNLPDGYKQINRAFVAQHYGSVPAIQGLAKQMSAKEKNRLRVISFGDEIPLGSINFNDANNQKKFRQWLTNKKITATDLGMPIDKATLTLTGNARLAWYSSLFNEEERFGSFRDMTKTAETLFGKEVRTGANYSPHHLALYYGKISQWVDVFKHRGMSMIWAEDYIFSVPEAPQMVSWMFGQMRCGAKYHNLPIHFYVMPHGPGQVSGFLRRNLLLSLGMGAAHIDNFWVAPADRFTENYVGWGYTDTFRVLSETIYDAGEIEKYQVGGKVRPARVAIITGKATDANESRLMIDKKEDSFFKQCANADAKINQTLCRKDQQYLYLALRQAQHGVDLLTEDDVAEGYLKNYDVVYFAGEWIDKRAVTKLGEWVKAGGTLYATAGLGHKNQFDESDASFLTLLGLKAVKTSKNAIAPRTLLELPLQTSIGTITIDGKKIQAMGMKQILTPSSAKTLGTWSEGGAAVTVNKVGKGQAFAVGTLAGATWMKTGLRRIPYARGGRHVVYNPTGFSADATNLVRLGVEAAKPVKSVVCGVEGVEGIVIDHKDGTLVTLVNWTNAPIKGLTVKVRLDRKPASARSVTKQSAVAVTHKDGVASFTLDVNEGDFVLLPK